WEREHSQNLIYCDDGVMIILKNIFETFPYLQDRRPLDISCERNTALRMSQMKFRHCICDILNAVVNVNSIENVTNTMTKSRYARELRSMRLITLIL
ncbi:hypothetical protein L9F63_006533, partial [Diploptera punctata]